MFSFETIMAIFETLGTVLIGIAALRVHHHVLTERKIDRAVIKTMRVEQHLGIMGILLIVLGFLLRFV